MSTEILFLIMIILTGTIIQSLFSMLFSPRKPKAPEFDQLTDDRYSRLGSEYEEPAAA